MKTIIAHEKQLVDIFQMAERTIRDNFSSARVSPGKYDLVACIRIYVENKKQDEYDKEIKRIDKETKKLKLEILEGKYHSVESIQSIVLDMLANFKSKICVLPTKLKQDLKAQNLITSKNSLAIQKLLKEKLNETLLELSEYEYTDIEKEEDDEE